MSRKSPLWGFSSTLNNEEFIKTVITLDNDSLRQILHGKEQATNLRSLADAFLEDKRVAEHVIATLEDQKDLLTLFEYKLPPAGEIPVAFIFFAKHTGRIVTQLVNKMNGIILAAICHIKFTRMEETAGRQFFYYQGPQQCYELIAKLNDQCLSDVMVMRAKDKFSETPAAQVLKKLNSSLAQALMARLDCQTLSAALAGQDLGFYNFVFGTLDAKTCETLIYNLDAKLLVPIVNKIFSNENRDWIERTICKETAEILRDCRDSFETPAACMRDSPEKFIAFLHRRMQTWKGADDTFILIKLIEKARQEPTSATDDFWQELITQLNEMTQTNLRIQREQQLVVNVVDVNKDQKYIPPFQSTEAYNLEDFVDQHRIQKPGTEEEKRSKNSSSFLPAPKKNTSMIKEKDSTNKTPTQTPCTLGGGTS